MSLKVKLDIYDVAALLQTYCKQKFGQEITGVTIMSWNAPIADIDFDRYGVTFASEGSKYHRLVPEHSELFPQEKK